MVSLITGLLSALWIGPAPLKTDVRDCPQLLYPDLSSDSCKSYGALGHSTPEDKPPPILTPAQTSCSTSTDAKAVEYLNRTSLTDFSDKSVPLICRKGVLAVFQNGEPLYSYQAQDVQRMYDREVAGVSTILAYNMGLGKTGTTAAVICTNRTVQSGMCPTTLVIAPNIGILQHWLLQHWLAELKRFAPKLDVLLYHGQGKRQDPGLPDVTLLTLSELRNQYTTYWDENVVDQQKFPLYTKKWHRVVIEANKALSDEAHSIRNPDSASAKALKKSHALCLTGTPAQNSLRDLFPLLKFIDVKTQGLNNRATLVTNPYKRGEIVKTTALLVADSVQHALRECMIYRPKDSGLGAIRLPKRHNAVLVRIDLTLAERDVYGYISLIHPFKSQWAKIVRLRKAVDHPALLTKALHHGDIDAKPDETSDQMRVLLDQSNAEVDEIIAQDVPLTALPAALAGHAAIFKSTYMSSKLTATFKILDNVPRGEKAIVFFHFLTSLDMMAEILSRNGVSYAGYDGRMSASQRADALDQIHTEAGRTILLASIMAGGTGLDIPACNHEQAVSRVHHIGQVREVRVYRLLAKHSIEDSIIKTQNAKREVVGGLLSLCAVPDEEEIQNWLA
ncbi:P-loop containing nucleoside triphosphate hydrolase protein [Mycena maculata]|uniref:P-loop containing nucleoside triphosphate hydrolase protein n=1 Tax=Mycena maculata TaxID=230809 RepID=A0AAD7NMQ4_9AGAR|nr:P-loop containing nucleoside triphosphate hydrolase protein [Mycena maculata]